jgi:hypothetical protein
MIPKKWMLFMLRGYEVSSQGRADCRTLLCVVDPTLLFVQPIRGGIRVRQGKKSIGLFRLLLGSARKSNRR